MRTLEQVWPLFGLRIAAGPLQMRAVRDADVPLLVELAEGGIHDPDAMPFSSPWSTAPVVELGPNMARFYWHTRAEFTPTRWDLELVVLWQDQIVGCQGFTTQNYLTTRTGETGSWLGREFQRQGIGTAMRQTICAFLFDHLSAEEVTSAAFVDNPPSLAVSRKTGYRPNGQTRERRRDGELAISQKLSLRPGDLVRFPHPLVVEGAAEVPAGRARRLTQLPPVRRTAARCCDRLVHCGLLRTGCAPRRARGWSGSRSGDEDAERVAGGVGIDAQRLLGILGAVS